MNLVVSLHMGLSFSVYSKLSIDLRAGIGGCKLLQGEFS